MGTQDEWDKQSVYTLIGYYQKDNTFVDLNGEVFECITYREFNRMLNPDQLVCVNMRWTDVTGEWIIFQAVPLDNELKV